MKASTWQPSSMFRLSTFCKITRLHSGPNFDSTKAAHLQPGQGRTASLDCSALETMYWMFMPLRGSQLTSPVAARAQSCCWRRHFVWEGTQPMMNGKLASFSHPMFLNIGASVIQLECTNRI